MENIIETSFGKTGSGEAKLYTLSSDRISAGFTDYGCILARLTVPDRNGVPRSVVLGYDSAEGYEAGTSFLGATVGRYAGRIGGAGFGLFGRRFTLSENDGENHLHGGFSKRFYSVRREGDSLVFSLVSPDMDEGFPGELRLSVRVAVYGNTLRIGYEAETDAPTVLNITNHSYFDLSGNGAAGHRLKVFADRYAETEGMIPTGRILPVAGTPLDFTCPRPIKDALDAPELAATRGLDHSFVLPETEGKPLRDAALLSSEETGITLLCRTTQPTVHVYTAGFLDLDSAAQGFGKPLLRHGGVCLETQHLPDSPNRPEFPGVTLMPGERFREVTEFVFGTMPEYHGCPEEEE